SQCGKFEMHIYSSPDFVSKSARVSLCLGFAAAFSLTVGSGNELFGVPTLSRALAFTAFVTEKVFFFDFAITSPFSTRLLAYRTLCGSILFSVGGWAICHSRNATFLTNDRRCGPTP